MTEDPCPPNFHSRRDCELRCTCERRIQNYKYKKKKKNLKKIVQRAFIAVTQQVRPVDFTIASGPPNVGG